MTTCVSPPELDEQKIMDYLNGKDDPQIAEHLTQCPSCRDKAKQMAQAQNILHARLFRINCPTSDELRDYHFGFLPDAQVTEITEHLGKCPHCTHDLVQLNEFLAEAAPETAMSPLQRIKTIIAELMQGGQGALTPAYAGMRGGNAEDNLIYQAGEISIGLNIQSDTDQPDYKELLGSVSGLESGELTAHLWHAQQLVATTPVDDLDSFSFSQLAPGHYELILSTPTVKIQIPNIRV